MNAQYMLGIWDYCVIALVMLISVAIGYYFHSSSSSSKSANDFLMAGQNMSRFPVVMSLVVSKMSAISLIGEPADVYMHGAERLINALFLFVGAFVAAYVFLPVFFSVGSPTIYAYLGKRFGRSTRSVVSTLGFIHLIFLLAVILYTPSLALEAVTGLSLTTSILLMGGVCILFSAMGGMRAVMWADVFQSFFMYACLIAIIVFGLIEANGIQNVYNAAIEDGKLSIPNFSFDPTIRYTFWNSLALGIQYGVVTVIVNQTEMQRALSIKKLKHAQSAFVWYAFPSSFLFLLVNASGLILYAVFRDSDPLSEESGIGLKKADQIVPYYIVSRMKGYPGLAGLCVSGIFCASITSLSSALNSMSTVVIDDFLSPLISKKTSAKINFNILAKVLMVVNGSVITLLPFILPFSKGVYEIIVIVYGVLYGPVFGLYLLGMLTETANEKGSLIGLISGISFTTWIVTGAKLTRMKETLINVKTFYNVSSLSNQDFYNTTWNFPFNITQLELSNTTGLHSFVAQNSSESPVFILYRLSFTWIGTIGIITTFITGFIISFALNRYTKNHSVDALLLSPIAKCWNKKVTKEPVAVLQEFQPNDDMSWRTNNQRELNAIKSA